MTLMENKPVGREANFSRWMEWGRGELAFLGEREARQECEKILITLSEISRPELYLATEADPRTFPRFSEWVQARKRRIPLAYLLKKAYFWEDELEVEEGVFIPRPETETLIEAFLNTGGFAQDAAFRFLDLGTGSGNIAVTLAKLFPNSRPVASDVSQKALALCAKNAGRLGVEKRLELIQGDGLSGFEKETFDVIFSNPPYVASGEWTQLDPEVLLEPRQALDGGEEGLDFYQIIFQDLSCLGRGGSLWVEIGWNQSGRVRSLFEREGFDVIRVFKDLNDIDRVIGGMGFDGQAGR